MKPSQVMTAAIWFVVISALGWLVPGWILILTLLLLAIRWQIQRAEGGKSKSSSRFTRFVEWWDYKFGEN